MGHAEARLHAFARQQGPFCRAVYPSTDGQARATYFDTLGDLLEAGASAAWAVLEARRLLEGAQDPAYRQGVEQGSRLARSALEAALRRPPRPARQRPPRRRLLARHP